jgi:uncharacterized protein YndB with AHSA1/START domain
MPIKRDETGKHWVEMELLVPGTPEQVWQAMATGPGNTAWFTKASIEERVGGALQFDFGPMGSTKGEVTAWEPPRRFGYVERDWAEGAPPVATEITVTARAGGKCVVRMVHSLFTSGDDWDEQLEGFESGWPGFFEVLRVYLTHFAGMPAASFSTLTSIEEAEFDVWKRLSETIGLAGADVGDKLALAGPERLSGIVERVRQDNKQRYVILRLDGSQPGIALIGSYEAGKHTNASAAFYFYGENAESRAAASEPAWRSRFAELVSD